MMRWAATVFILLFFTLIVVVSLNNRPAADDYYYLYCVPQKGILACVSDLYHGYSARWTAYTLAAAVIPVKWLFTVSSLFLVILISIASSAIIKVLSKRLYSFSLSPVNAFITGVMLCSAFFFTTFSVPESWFWMIQVCTYGMSMAAQLFILYCLVSEKKNGLLMLTSAVFAGGSSESYALVLMAVLLLLFAFRGKLPDKIFPLKYFHFKILLALAGCFISFIIMISSKGNAVRYEALPHAAPLELSWIVLKTWGKALIIKPFFVLHYYLLYGALAFYTGRLLATGSGILFSEFFSGWLKPILLLPFMVLIMILPATLVMSGPPPDRAMMQVSFTWTAFILLICFEGGRKLKALSFEKAAMNYSVPAWLLIMIVFNIIQQSVITRQYAKAYDERLVFLEHLKAKGNKETVTLKPLPESGMIYSAEISEYEVHFTNSFLKKYLKLNFEIRKAEDGS